MLDRFRDAFFRVFRFAGGHADEFRPLEGETGDEKDAKDGEEMPARAVAEEGAVARGEVAEADVLAAHDAEDGERADAEEDDDGDDFNQRKPVFGFAVGAHGKGIERADDAKEGEAPAPGGHERAQWLPVGDDDGGDGDVHRDGDDPVEPVIPAKGKAERGIDVARGVSGK